MHSDLIVIQSGFVLLCGLFQPNRKAEKVAVGHWSALLRKRNGNDNNAQDRQKQKKKNTAWLN